MAVAYDPAKQYEIKVWDVEYRRDPVRTLLARIWVMHPGPQTDRAIAMIKAFIARQLHARQPVG